MRLFLLFLMLLSETSVAQSDERPVVRWALAPYAPFHIEDGPKAGQGVVDLALKGMMEALPEYHHVPLVMNASRAWQDIRDGEPVCHPAALKTPERERHAVFSDAGAIVPSMVVILRAEDAARVAPGKSTVSLMHLLKDEKLRPGILSERAYGDVQEVLEEPHGTTRPVRVSNNYGPFSLIRMLYSGRIDLMVEYPWILHFVKEHVPEAGVPLVALGIEESPPFYTSHVACANTPRGREIVARLNGWIATRIPLEENLRILGDWLDPITLERYRAAYEEMLSPLKAAQAD